LFLTEFQKAFLSKIYDLWRFSRKTLKNQYHFAVFYFCRLLVYYRFVLNFVNLHK